MKEKKQYPAIKKAEQTPAGTFVAYDIETTGLSPENDCITEIGAVLVRDGEIVDSFQELVRLPEGKLIPPRVVELTGITNEMVADARSADEVLQAFLDFAGKETLVGFNNARFDNLFMAKAAYMAGVTIENDYFDVYYPSGKYAHANGLINARLCTVSEHFKIENPQAHRAMADAATTAKLFLELQNRGYLK